MAEVERKVTEEVETTSGDNGEVVRERTRSVQSSNDPRSTVINLVRFVYSLIAIFLGMRLVFKLLGANSANGFVDFVYSVSGVLSAPFDNIFGVTETEAGNTDSVFEPSILVAILVYALIAWGIARLLTVDKN